jgi:hypothetical protein
MTVKIPRQVRVTEAPMSESAIIVCDGDETVLVVRAGLLPCDVMLFLAGASIAHEVLTSVARLVAS